VKALLGHPECVALPALRAFLKIDGWMPLIDSGQESGRSRRSSDGEGLDKWRLLFRNLRTKLRPREVPVRTRLFQGVFTGADVVTAVLLVLGDAREASSMGVEGRAGACLVGEALVGARKLVPVATGFLGPSGAASIPLFADDSAFIYRFDTSYVHDVTLFGAPVSVAVPPGDGSRSKRVDDTTEYCIVVTHGGASWTVTRRENELAETHRALLALGIKPPVQFPTLFFRLGDGQYAAMCGKVEGYLK
jgi:hypothetical protein